MSFSIRFLPLCTLLCLLPLAELHAQEVLTPEESVERALEEHGLLRSTEAEAREAEAALREARSTWWPSISTQASYTRLSDNIPAIEAEFPGLDTTFAIAPVELNRYHAEVSIEQPLFTGLRRLSQNQAAEHRAGAAREEVDRQRSVVAFETRQAYWSLFEARARLEALEASLEQVEAHLEDVRRQQEVGAALERNVLAAQTRRSEVLLDRVEAENAVRSARLELIQLTGLPADAELELSAEPDGEPPEASLDELVAEARSEHPELSALREEVSALESDRRSAGRQWLPEAALTGRYLYARPNQYFFTEQDRFRPSWEAGVVFRWDLWDGGRRGAETEQASARLEGARARLEHVEERLEAEVTRRYLDAEGAREAVEVARETVDEAEESFRVVQQQFETGAALSTDVLEAEAALRAAQSREAAAEANYATARAGLLNALGRIW